MNSRASIFIPKHGPILHVLCVSFHHRNGPQVEFANPPFPEYSSTPSSSPALHKRSNTESSMKNDAVVLPEEWGYLPFICLPDGAHATEGMLILFQINTRIYH